MLRNIKVVAESLAVMFSLTFLTNLLHFQVVFSSEVLLVLMNRNARVRSISGQTEFFLSSLNI